ncbi:MAG TPA: pseudouridine synthase [Mycobacteriales bacterium]|nr:pseudouridine synthase [Mycobacteriales bacterium]
MRMTDSRSEVEAVRLQKVLASAGIASRRASEELIRAGRVSVDGNVVRELGTRVDPSTAVVRVDGEIVLSRPDLTYLALHKPAGVLSAMSDPSGRPTIADLLPARARGAFHVGRLDADTEGLLLVTTDGPLAHRLTHPSFGVAKTYLADVEGIPSRATVRALRAGPLIDDRPVAVDGVRVVETAGRRALLEVVVHEGRKHVVRRMLADAGLPVRRLVRTAIGEVRLGELAPGRTRPLNRHEVSSLYRLVDL